MSSQPDLRIVYLVGVKNTGKSHVGRMLASDLGSPFLDLDNIIEELYERESGRRLTVRRIYALDNGTSFRRLEHDACMRASKRKPAPVVATGGGICDNDEAVALLRDGLVVALNANADILFERIMRGGIPAFLAAKTLEAARREFEELHRRRWKIYRDLAAVAADTSSCSPRDCASRIAKEIKELRHGGK